ncbi:MAG: cell division ATP-binding protein FtsE [Lachnospiraceae bacterium]|nr:cell division ATP-binding protein FtsE [Lachnospiraceae bacterium]
MIKMDNVTMQYPNGTVALDNINLKIEHGEFVFVVGESGSGKTTFVELVLRELKPTKGRIEVVGYDYANVSDKYIHKIRRMIGTVFQDFRLLPDMTVYENVAFAQKVIETPSRIIANQVPQVLSLVGLADKYRSFPAQLSGGEQQKVALARAIVNKPDIILADEPTGNLDPKNSWDIMKLLEEINARGTTVVVVTHNKEIVNTMKKRVVVLKEGKILSDEQEGEYRDED